MELFAGVIIVSVWAFTLWSIRKMLRLQTYEEAADEPFAEYPFAEILAPLKPNPKGRAGAIAMVEPDDDVTDAFPPRAL